MEISRKATSNYLDLVDNSSTLDIKCSVADLDTYCAYVLNDKSTAMSFTNLLNLKDYISYMNLAETSKQDAKLARFYFLKYYLEGKIEKGLSSRDIIFTYIRNNAPARYLKIIEREIIDGKQQDNLGNSDITYINKMLLGQLNSVFLYRYRAPIIKMLEEIELGSANSDESDLVEFFQSLLTKLNRNKRRSTKDNRFNLSDKDLFKSVVRDTCERVNSKNEFLITGWKGFNKLLNGGFENSRVYNIIGATGGFKSGLLSNLTRGFKLFNTDKKPKDPTKLKTILHISQENSLHEDMGRFYTIFTGEELKGRTYNEAMKNLGENHLKMISKKDDIDIEFRHYGNEDISVDHIRGIIEELSAEGREVIAVLHDYIERLKPPSKKVDRRIQLFDISNQLHELAVDFDIPIITASQYNKEGVAIVEDMRKNNKIDIGRNIGTRHVSESFGMLKNFDVNIGIVIERDPITGKQYLSMNKMKFRGADLKTMDFILQPFEGENVTIKLMDDIDLDTSLYKVTLANKNYTYKAGAVVEKKVSTDDVRLTTRDMMDIVTFEDDKVIFDERMTEIEKERRNRQRLRKEEEERNKKEQEALMSSIEQFKPKIDYNRDKDNKIILTRKKKKKEYKRDKNNKIVLFSSKLGIYKRDKDNKIALTLKNAKAG